MLFSGLTHEISLGMTTNHFTLDIWQFALSGHPVAWAIFKKHSFLCYKFS